MMIKHVLYAVFITVLMPGLLQAEGQRNTFHTDFWANEAHKDQRNELIAWALETPALYAYEKEAEMKTVFHNICECDECMTLQFQYRYDGGSLSELDVLLKDSKGNIQWKRHTTFHEHDAEDASRSWPLESVETLYDGSQKKTYYRWTNGYGACVIHESYDLSSSGVKVPETASFAEQERSHWDEAVKKYGNTFHTIYDNNSLRNNNDGTMRILGEPLEDGLYRFFGVDIEVIANVVQSKIEGKIYGYSVTGVLMAEGNFLHGKEEGIQIEYYENGQKYKEESYHHGKKEGEQYKYFEDGSMMEHRVYKSGKPHGKQLAYFANGHKKRETTFYKGEKEGQECWYYENMNPRACETFHKGQRHGKFQRYYEDGSLHWEMTFIEDVLNGGASEYYPNGQLRSKVLYINGLRQGMMTYFDKEGIVRLEERFRDGIPVERFIILPNGMRQLVPIH